MTIGRILFIVGILLSVYAFISGLHFHISVNDGNFNYSNGYSFKVGTLVLGIILIYVGKRLEK